MQDGSQGSVLSNQVDIDVSGKHLTLDYPQAKSVVIKIRRTYVRTALALLLEINAKSLYPFASASDKWLLQVIDYKSAGHSFPACPLPMTSSFTHADHLLSDVNLKLS